jgi:transcriptional regulator with XRE-family HTH domain
MTFASRLRQLRETAGLTQEQLAERSGINLWTIRGYEQGRREPSWKGLLALANALGVAAEVFGESEEKAAPEEPAVPRGRPQKQAEAAEPGKGKAAGQAGKRKEKR